MQNSTSRLRFVQIAEKENHPIRLNQLYIIVLIKCLRCVFELIKLLFCYMYSRT